MPTHRSPCSALGKQRKSHLDLQQLEIRESVFTQLAPHSNPAPAVRAFHESPKYAFKKQSNAQPSPWRAPDDQPPITPAEFTAKVDKVRQAIQAGQHPRLNPKGSSGSCLSPSSTPPPLTHSLANIDFCKDLEGNIIGSTLQ